MLYLMVLFSVTLSDPITTPNHPIFDIIAFHIFVVSEDK